MRNSKTFRNVLLLSISSLAVAACGGADDVASPGEGVIVIPSPTPTPTPTTPTPTTPTKVTAAASCPTIAGPNQLSDLGTISGPQGEWRNCAFPARFTASTQIPKQAGVIYSLPGRVDVGTDQGSTSTNTDVTLTIDPGVTIFGATGVSYLAVNRGNKIDAVGTPTQPIVFTGRANVTGAADDNTSQLWGGVILLGRAPVHSCLAPGATPGTASCERDTEGTSNALYGGAQPNDNSGRMSYVQIRYSGFVLSADKELQGLTPSGVGSATQIDHIQMHNSSDDGIEVFGGRPNFKHLVVTGAEDDGLDVDVGYKGSMQFVIVVQRQGVGDSMIEAESNGDENAVPRTNFKLANFTFIHRNTGGNNAAILLRGGGDYTLANGVIHSPVTCLRVNGAATMQATGSDEAGPPVIRSVAAQCGTPRVAGSGGVTNDQVEALITGNNNNFSFTTSLSNVFVNGANENGVTPTNASTLDAFFINTNYIGAVRDANDTWYAGWTCNSSTADFGTSSKSCTLIPV